MFHPTTRPGSHQVMGGTPFPNVRVSSATTAAMATGEPTVHSILVQVPRMELTSACTLLSPSWKSLLIRSSLSTKAFDCSSRRTSSIKDFTRHSSTSLRLLECSPRTWVRTPMERACPRTSRSTRSMREDSGRLFLPAALRTSSSPSSIFSSLSSK